MAPSCSPARAAGVIDADLAATGQVGTHLAAAIASKGKVHVADMTEYMIDPTKYLAL